MKKRNYFPVIILWLHRSRDSFRKYAGLRVKSMLLRDEKGKKNQQKRAANDRREILSCQEVICK